MGLSPTAFLRFGAALADTTGTAGLAMLGSSHELALSRWCRRLGRHLGLDVRVHGPLPEAQLWVANHLSWLDPLVLLGLRPAGILAKAEVSRYPLVGAGARRLGLHFVQREEAVSRASALAKLSKELQRGRPFLIFPEGTTTTGQSLARLHEGGLRTAHRLGISVLPLRLDSPDPHYPWIGDASLLPHLMGLCSAPRTRISVVPRARLHPGDFPDAQAWIRALRDQLLPAPSLEMPA